MRVLSLLRASPDLIRSVGVTANDELTLSSLASMGGERRSELAVVLCVTVRGTDGRGFEIEYGEVDGGGVASTDFGFSKKSAFSALNELPKLPCLPYPA